MSRLLACLVAACVATAGVAGGPPQPDHWQVRVAVGEPIVVDPAYLADQRVTRQYLWHVCLEMRKYLSLPPPDLGVEAPETAGQDQ